MFEQIKEKRYQEAVTIVDGMRDYSAETIIMSRLPDFTKSFIVNDGAKYNSKDELLKVIEKSVRLNLNYCLRPKWTLINYLYGKYDSKSSNDIAQKTEIFTYYSFYTESIKELCNDEAYISLPRNVVEELISHIDKDIHEKLTTNTTSLKVKNFFLQVFKLKYGDSVEISLDMTIPYSLVKLFLDDKGFKDVIDMFTDAGFTNDNEELDLKTLIKVISGKIKEVNLPKSEISSVITTAAVEATLNEPQETVTAVDFSKSDSKTDAETINPEIKPIRHSSRVGYDNTFENTSTKEEQPEPQKISGEFIEKEELGEKHLRFYFKEEEIKAISKKVFKGNKYTFIDSLLEIEKLKNWREATEYLKKIFIENKVSLGDKNVIMFVDVLNDYFEKR